MVQSYIIPFFWAFFKHLKSTKKGWKWTKKCFYHLLGACSTHNLVKIHNKRHCTHICSTMVISWSLLLTYFVVVAGNNYTFANKNCLWEFLAFNTWDSCAFWIRILTNHKQLTEKVEKIDKQRKIPIIKCTLKNLDNKRISQKIVTLIS